MVTQMAVSINEEIEELKRRITLLGMDEILSYAFVHVT